MPDHKLDIMNALAPGFADPVFDNQAAFRSVMEALANPGRIRPVSVAMPDAPLTPSAAAVILALCDFETPLYLAPHVAAMPGVAEFVGFHTGAPLVTEPSQAAFAVVALGADGLDPGRFSHGVPDYPDRSTTVVALCDSVDGGDALVIAGPGIARVAELRVTQLPVDFKLQWQATRARFPLGVDVIFASPGRIVGLPRSTRIPDEAS
jgi:alpha-D-ribose 1-methylphosphonate 5-triphosphate synthase subunit PhnH